MIETDRNGSKEGDGAWLAMMDLSEDMKEPKLVAIDIALKRP